MSLGKKKMLSQGGAGALVPSDNFNTVLWTGNNTARTIPVGFQPDLIWLKNRNNNGNSSHRHLWYDSVRGVSAGYIHSDGTSIQEAYPAVTGFVSTGFSLGGGSVGTADAGMNDGSGSGGTYVGWCWYAPTSETNNAGSNGATIASTIKKNIDAGFSIVKYEGTGATATVSHGLSSIVELLIVKGLETTNDWSVLHKDGTNGEFLQLNGFAAESGCGSIFGSPFARPTDSVFTIGNTGETGTNGKDYIAYCFHSVAGYQKVSKYNGTSGSVTVSDVGFQPRWIMIKRRDGAADWEIVDSVRGDGGFNTAKFLEAGNTGAEFSQNGYGVTFTSTGFTIPSGAREGLNVNGEVFIYLAIG